MCCGRSDANLSPLSSPLSIWLIIIIIHLLSSLSLRDERRQGGRKRTELEQDGTRLFHFIQSLRSVTLKPFQQFLQAISSHKLIQSAREASLSRQCWTEASCATRLGDSLISASRQLQKQPWAAGVVPVNRLLEPRWTEPDREATNAYRHGLGLPS